MRSARPALPVKGAMRVIESARTAPQADGEVRRAVRAPLTRTRQIADWRSISGSAAAWTARPPLGNGGRAGCSGLYARPCRKDGLVAQTKTSQRNPSRYGVNREQARRGGAVAPAAGRTSVPLPAAGGRGRRTGGLGSIVDFLRDIRSELRKVSWPSTRETTNLTIVVIALSVAVGLVLGGVDYIFQEFFRLVLSLSGNGGF